MSKQTSDKSPFYCHFKPMHHCFAGDYPNGQVEFFECEICGHTKDINRPIKKAVEND